MRIIRAEHLGLCFGVRDAIALALREASKRPLTILGELVHNERVLASLRKQGIRIESQLSPETDSNVMITAHGASNQSIRRLHDQGLNVLEATCPLVRVVHRAVADLVRDGYHPVIIGKRDHVEVRGITGDLAEHDVVLCEAEVMELQERSRFGVVAQTTQPIERVRYLVSLIRRRFPNAELRFIDTVCQPTKQRQTAAIELARQSDVVIVIGGRDSNNTKELVATCGLYCEKVHHVQTTLDLQPEWFSGAETVGITAGTSTPDEVIESVEERLRVFASSKREEASDMKEALEPAAVQS